MAVIATDKYEDIATLYTFAVKQTLVVADYYYQAAQLVLLVDDFAPELDLLKPFYQAYLTALTAYSGYPGSTVDAVRALQEHVLKEARDGGGNRFIDINAWYADTGVTIDGCFADISSSAGYAVEDAYCLLGTCSCTA